jgi:4-hydroxybenzoate polyprenyltransferase
MISIYFDTLRVKQYIKNLFIFIPVFISGNLNSFGNILDTVLVFCLFSLITSGIYIFNDIRDREYDKNHALKCKRPIASGRLSIQYAYVLMVVIILPSLGMVYTYYSQLASIILLYIALNILYSLGLKHIAIVDVIIVAFGFIIRILIGGMLFGINITPWLLVMIFLLALFLVLAKRRDDLLEESGTNIRKNISNYNITFIDYILSTISAVILVGYILYTTSDIVIQSFNFEYVYLSSIFVLIGFLRYAQNIFVFKESASPTHIILKDKFLQITILCFILFFTYIVYIK